MDIEKKIDSDLVVLLTQNNETAFCQLYTRYKDKLYYFCLSLLKSKEEANDIVQEIFSHIWESRSFINPELSFSSFLYTMARNRIFNYFRDIDIDIKIKEIIALKTPVEEEYIESDLIYTEYQKILTDAIDAMPPQRKKVFNLSRKENLSHKEIAARLDISVNTVQQHISESLKFIKLYFNKHDNISLGLLLLLGI